MNFTAVRGFNAYSQFSAKIREAVKSKTEEAEETEDLQKDSSSVYTRPIDSVSISKSALEAYDALKVKQAAEARLEQIMNKTHKIEEAKQEEIPSPLSLRENSPHVQFREWARTSGIMRGGFSQNIPGSVINKALSGTGITVGDDEEYNVTIDVLSAATVSSKNTEKAKAIQNLLNSTPSGINWGLLLATLPPS